MHTEGRAPSLFISHKHADREIANVIREFVYERTNREVSVFQSSAVDADAPELGRVLSSELKKALWETGVVILIYTTEDQDWQWCMWECGVATNQASPELNDWARRANPNFHSRPPISKRVYQCEVAGTCYRLIRE